jgi:hypothetical protein
MEAGDAMFVSTDPRREVLLEEVVDAFDAISLGTGTMFRQPRSYIVNRLATLHAAGCTSVDYETLMTVSGFGTGFAYEPRERFWAHYVQPEGADDRIARATGHRFEWLERRSVDFYWQTLVETIDSGRPVHAHHLEDVLFLGYRMSPVPRERAVRPLSVAFVDPGEWWTWDTFRHWFHAQSRRALGRTSGRIDPPPPDESAIEVLETVLTLATDDPRERREDLAGVKWGIEGIEAYIADIANLDLSGEKDVHFQAGWLGCHNIYPQFTGRLCTAVWLDRLGRGRVFQEDVSEHLLLAARAYERAYAAWQQWEGLLGRPGVAPEGAWTIPENRRAGADAVRRALIHEKAALVELQRIHTYMTCSVGHRA